MHGQKLVRKLFMEIRLHGRGGQGGVTCAKILAAVYARLGKSVQTFGDYAGERSGAPVRAYTRVEEGVISNRNKVYAPDHILVLDSNLMGDLVVSGLKPGGTILLNTSEPLSTFANRWPEYRLAVVDATSIARSHKIGTRSVVIVNTTIAGAFVAAMDLPISLLTDTYASLGFSSNDAAAVEASEKVEIRDALIESTNTEVEDTAVAGYGGAAGEAGAVLPLTEHRESGPTGLKTGSWSSQRPDYVENLAPCSAWCPAGNNVIAFLQELGRNNQNDDLLAAQSAAGILGRTTPFSSVCGNVCPAPCMEGCNRVEMDGSVNIRALERWVGERETVAAKVIKKTSAEPKRVAVIGGGPAGLTAAWWLQANGHQACIYEGESKLGGVLRTGIPEYRLPRKQLDREIAAILDLGVEDRCGEFLSTEKLQDLSSEYDGIVFATGLQKLRSLGLPGEDGSDPEIHVEQGINFLHRVNFGGEANISGDVIVLGGGNTAMDCARTALREGADTVSVVYRRTRTEMPAIREEIEEAAHGGVQFFELRQPVAFRKGELLVAECDLGEPDESGRRRPIVSDRVLSLPCDYALLALGQSADMELLPDEWQLAGEEIKGGGICSIFMAGDFVTGDGTVTHAIGSGRRAADLLMKSFGDEIEVFTRPDRTVAVPATEIRFSHFKNEAPLTDNEIKTSEANRCFSCGHCTECDTCLVYCPEGIIRRQTEVGYEVDYSYCKGCGICVTECPRDAMVMN